MPKPKVRKSPPSSQFSPQLSPDEELAIFRSAVAELKKNPKELRKVAIRAGIVTPTGKLTKGYRD